MRQDEKRYVWALWLLAGAALAHGGQGPVSGFGQGLGHPLGGLDHLLAMLAVGLWAAQVGGRAVWAVPLAFVGAMALGGALGIAGVPLPFVETGILASVLFLGALILFSARLPLWAGAALVGLFAVFHGHAHGAEMPASVSGLEYALGFVLATALLHLIGVAVGLLAGRLAKQPGLHSLPLLRTLGALVLVGGVYLGMA